MTLSLLCATCKDAHLACVRYASRGVLVQLAYDWPNVMPPNWHKRSCEYAPQPLFFYVLHRFELLLSSVEALFLCL